MQILEKVKQHHKEKPVKPIISVPTFISILDEQDNTKTKREIIINTEWIAISIMKFPIILYDRVAEE